MRYNYSGLNKGIVVLRKNFYVIDFIDISNGACLVSSMMEYWNDVFKIK